MKHRIQDASVSNFYFRNFRTFLNFDTREFLNVLSLSFEEPLFQTELGKRQKQRMVDILLQVMVEQGNFTVCGSRIFLDTYLYFLFYIRIFYKWFELAYTSGSPFYIPRQANGSI
jgi:hypothetical protein